MQGGEWDSQGQTDMDEEMERERERERGSSSLVKSAVSLVS